MATKKEIIQQINFALDQLSSRNGQHEFEHLCRHFARKRICLNVMPATGPVQAGGDQGKDFETFRSYLATAFEERTAFIGVQSGLPIAFACSLEQQPEKKNGKIQKDVENILTHGQKPDCIYFFSNRAIVVSKRNILKTWAEETHGVKLEIIDRETLAEQLSDSDTFWIANEYLAIPIESYPRPLNEEEEYSELLKKWSSVDELQYTFEELVELVWGARSVYKSSESKHDLSIWLTKLEQLAVFKGGRILARRAQYEFISISLIGKGTLLGKESVVRDYFSDYKLFLDSNSISDTGILISLVSMANKNNAINISDEELVQWKTDFESIIQDELKAPQTNDNRMCTLIQIEALSLLNAVLPIESYAIRFAKGVEKLAALSTHLPNAPLFPLEQLTNALNSIISLLLKLNTKLKIDFSPLEQQAQSLDEFMAKRYGGFKAASNYRNRAILYRDSGEILKAIDLLHKAKINWLADETMRGAILSHLVLAECYGKLRMNFAAKYYALAASQFAIQSGKPTLMAYLPQGLFAAAQIEFRSGAWTNYLALIDLAVAADYSVNGPLGYESAEVKHVLYRTLIIKYFDRKFNLGLGTLIDNRTSNLGDLKTEIDSLFAEYDTQFDNAKGFDTDDLLGQLDQFPFNDLGEKRQVDFFAFGISWHITFSNNFETNAIAEQFVGVLQVLLVELADEDIHNIETNVKIELLTSKDIDQPNFKRMSINKEVVWEVCLPIFDGSEPNKIDNSQVRYVALASAILHECSLLSDLDFHAILKKEFDNDLGNKIAAGIPFEQIYRMFFDEEKFNKDDRGKKLVDVKFNISRKEHTFLKWKSDTSKLYDAKESHEAIKRRYVNSLKPVTITFERIKNQPWFLALIEDLRRKGWRDWHIIMVLTNRILSYKAQAIFGNIENPGQFHKQFIELANKEEKDCYIEIPSSALEMKELEVQLKILAGILLPSYSLSLNTESPNFDAVWKLLEFKFNVKTDDVAGYSPLI